MSEILFLAHRIPFPPDRGDKIRSHHVLKRLAQIAPVHVATFADDALDMVEQGRLAEVAASYRLVRRSKPLPLAGVQALAFHSPVSLTAFASRELAAYVDHVVSTRPVSVIYVFSGQMGQYVPKAFTGRVVADFVDVDSAKFEAYSQAREGLRGWVDAREARMLRAEEARLAARSHVSVLISTEEAALFHSRLPEQLRAKVSVRSMPNGIDSTLFDPDSVAPESRMRRGVGPSLIFTGQMDYAPNIEAAERAMRSILPRIRARFPEASLHIVGRNPPETLRAIHGRGGCHVWGRVPDMRGWLKGADLALVPLEIGRGVQNKVLEAMAMQLPVVLTPQAATGIGAEDGCHFAIGHDDAGLADLAIALLEEPDRSRAMGAAARQYVIENASWEAALSNLPEMLGYGLGGARDAA